MRQEHTHTHTLDGYIFSARWREFLTTRQVRVAVWFSVRRTECVFCWLVLPVFVMCRVMLWCIGCDAGDLSLVVQKGCGLRSVL